MPLQLQLSPGTLEERCSFRFPLCTDSSIYWKSPVAAAIAVVLDEDDVALVAAADPFPRSLGGGVDPARCDGPHILSVFFLVPAAPPFKRTDASS